MRRAFGVSVAAVALRLAWPLGLELYGDEAYYHLWSRRLAFGYFDHPPMVAWLAWLSGLAGHSELALRLPFALCGGLAVFFSSGIAAELVGDSSGDDSRGSHAPLLAAFLAAVAPLPLLTSALAIPDAPLTAAVTGFIWLLIRGLSRGARGDLLWAGVLFGLALLSKYSAATLLPGLVVIALRDPEARRWLRRPAGWLAIALALAIFAPCVLWNARHGFVSFGFQLRHAAGVGFSAATFGAFAVVEAFGAGPLTLLLALPLLMRGESPGTRRLASLTLLPLLWFAYSALRGKFEANWPAFLDPALCAAAAGTLVRVPARFRTTLAFIGTAAAVAAVIVMGLELRHPRIVSPDNVDVARFHEGRALADGLRARVSPSAFLFTNDYQDAGELELYGGFARLGPALERQSQLDVWNSLPSAGESFVVVGAQASPEAVASRFPGAQLQRTDSFDITLDGAKIRTVALMWFDGFRQFER